MSHDQVIQWTKAEVSVHSDSVLCLGKLSFHKEAITSGELLGIDGEAIEFECNIFPGFTSLQILQEVQNDLQKRNIEPEKFTDRIILMSMFNDIGWTRKGKYFFYVELRKSQGVREEILVRTLEVPRSWTRKDMVWKIKIPS